MKTSTTTTTALGPKGPGEGNDSAAALKESERRFRAVFENLSLIGVLLDPTGRILLANDFLLKLTCWSREEVLGGNWFDIFLPPEIREQVRSGEFLKSIHAGSIPLHYQNEILTRAGDRRLVAWSNSVLLDAAGAVVGTASIGEDITERQRAEQSLRDAHRRLEGIIIGTRAGTWEWNVQTGETVLNERWAEILGYSIAELEPVSIKTWERLAHPEDLEKSGTLLERHFRGEIPYYDCECRMRHRDGRWIWVHDRGRVLTRTPDGKPLMMFGTHTDITARKEAEDALHESHELFSLFLRHSPIYTYIKAVSPTESRVVRASENFQELVGEHGKDMIGKTMADLFDGDFAAKITADDWSVVATGRLLRLEEAWQGRSYISIKFPIVQNGRTLLGGHTIDMTERNRAQEELRRSREQLRALSRHIQSAREEERTRIAREIHDELGQMLTALKMDLHLAEDLASELNDSRLNPLLDKLVAATELADSTITTVQRIASELRPGVLDRLGLLMALRNEAQQFEKRSGLRCIVDLPQEDPGLPADAATAFFRTFQEALTNVARHSGAGSVRAGFRADPEQWVLEVHDDGRGIAETDITDAGSLGLLGMRERARLLGGTVTFGRSVMGGTLVTVQLPRRIDPSEAVS